MKVQIKSLRAINCGPLRDVTIDFTRNGEPRPITLLAGANGSGKTTVLELIVHLAQVARFDHFTRQPSDDIFDRIEYARLDLLVDKNVVRMVLGETSSADPDTHVADILSIASDRSGSAFRHTDGWLEDMIEKQTDEPLWRIKSEIDGKLQVGSLLYLPFLRYLPANSGERVEREVTTYDWVHQYAPASRFIGSLDSYLIWLDYAEPDAFRETITFLDELDFDGKKFGVVRKELKAVVTTRDGQTHNVARLSSGEQNILIMLLELRRRLLPHSIVLIDEIENSLHPAFQHKLGNALLKMQQEIPFQLIATTHSREFLKIFGLENTLILTEF